MSDEAARRTELEKQVFQGIPGLVVLRPRWTPGELSHLPSGVFGGYQAIFRFPNGWGASLINGYGAYGIELAVTRWWTRETPHEEFELSLRGDNPGGPDSEYVDVIGWLDRPALERHLEIIAGWPTAYVEKSALRTLWDALKPEVTFYPPRDGE